MNNKLSIYFILYVYLVIKQNKELTKNPNIKLPIILIKNFAIPKPTTYPIDIPYSNNESKPENTLNNTIEIPSFKLDSPNAI